jgi:hypothetical protein
MNNMDPAKNPWVNTCTLGGYAVHFSYKTLARLFIYTCGEELLDTPIRNTNTKPKNTTMSAQFQNQISKS